MKKLLFLSVLSCFSLGMNAADFYVSKTGNDANTGADWDNSKLTISATVLVANTNGITDVDNIYIKEGTYNEKILLTLNSGSTNKSDKISLWGGFAASNTGVTKVRDIIAYPTYIDGTGLGTNSGPGLSVSRPSDTADGLIIQNWTATGTSQGTPAGLSLGDAASVVSNCIIRSNTHTSSNAKGSAAGVYITAGTMQDCQIYDNIMNGGGVAMGGGIQMLGGTVNRCIIYNNSAQSAGGGIYVGKVTTSYAVADYLALGANVTISNSLIYNNAKHGLLVGLITPAGSKTVTLTNNTIVNNEIPCSFAGGVSNTLLFATNNIFSNNGGVETFNELSSFTYNAINVASVTQTGNVALANSNTAVGFVSPSTVVGKSADASVTSADWRLATGSVCLDAGTGSGLGTDIAGNPRVSGAAIDLGAYEGSFTTGVGSIIVENNVYVSNGQLIVTGVSAYSVYNAQGVEVAKATSRDRISLRPGTYMVKVGSKTQKIFIK